MHIVTASDNNYAIGVLVLIASATRHNPSARFSVLMDRWSEGNIRHLDALAAHLGCRIDQIPVNPQVYDGLNVKRSHLTRATYLRLQIGDLFRDEERVLYMDSDMVVCGALSEAATVELTPGQVLGAVACPTPMRAALRELGLKKTEYFNAGLLVIDIGEWRSQAIAARVEAALKERPEGYMNEDESALNDILRGRWARLDARFNFYASDTIDQFEGALPADLRVIHYFVRPKPWRGYPVLNEVWNREFTAIAQVLGMSLPQFSLKDRIISGADRANELRKAYLGAWLGREKYRNFRAIRHHLQDRIVPVLLSGKSNDAT